MARFERWLEVRKIFEEALDVAPEERPSFLDRVCLGDEELRREIDALLNTPAVATSSLVDLLGLPERKEQLDYAEGDTIDRFTIVRRIKEGGMGVVYEARDTRNNNRPVALKVLLSRAAKLSQDKRIAGFADPSIVTFHDSGETSEGLPYFVFEYIEGEPITTFCERRNLGISERLRLFQKLCDALVYAHQRLIIHCDLKPENILVTATGALKLLDFGIAKQIGGEVTSRYPSPMTLPFASPEQVGNEETTTLSDVYSLGVLLCVLLTGRLPYRRAHSAADLRDAIIHEEPARPSDLVRLRPESFSDKEDVSPSYQPPPAKGPVQLARHLQGDLDAIVLRSLAKEPAKRYASAAELVEDVRKYLAHQPISVRVGSFRYRSWRFVQRHKPGFFMACLALIGLFAFILVIVNEQRETRAERDKAEKQAVRAEHVSRFLIDLFQLSDPKRQPGDVVTARELLDKASKELPNTLRNQPETQVNLLNTLGEIYINLGLLTEAGNCQSAALSIARKHLEPYSLETANTLYLIGILRSEEGHYAEAARLHQDALRIRRKRLPPGHPEIADSIYNLGVAALNRLEYSQAERLFRQSLSIRRNNPEPDQDVIGQSLNALGLLLGDLNRTVEAEDMLREALRLRETTYGKNHPMVAGSLGNLAVAVEMNGKLEEAEQLKRRALAISRNLLGRDHPDIAIHLSNLAFLLSVQQKDKEAIAIFQEALSVSERALGSDHPNTTAIKVNLARSLQTEKRFQEAERLLDQAYASAVQSADKDEWFIGNIIKTRAQGSYGKKQFDTAETGYRRAIDLFRKSEGPSSYAAAATMAELGTCLVAQGHFKEAEPILAKYLKVAAPRDRPEALWRLMSLYKEWDKPEMAAKYEELLAQQKAAEAKEIHDSEAP